jgi:hypothetical protein
MADNIGLKVLARVASLARRSVKDSTVFQTLLQEAGCFGKDQETLVNSLIGERLLQVSSELTSPIEFKPQTAAELNREFESMGIPVVKITEVVRDDDDEFDCDLCTPERNCYACSGMTVSEASADYEQFVKGNPTRSESKLAKVGTSHFATLKSAHDAFMASKNGKLD